MKKQLGHLFSLLCCSLLLSLLLSVSALAQGSISINPIILGGGDVCSLTIGSETSNYDSFSDAVNAAGTSEAEIKLLADLSGYLNISEGQRLTIDLNGHTIRSSTSTLKVNGGSLTLKNGTLSAGSTAVNVSGGSLTVDNVNISNSGNYAVMLSGGTIKFLSGSVKQNGSYNGNVFSVTGGTLYLAGGSFDSGISVSGGSVFISGGSFKTEPASSLLYGWCTVISGTDPNYPFTVTAVTESEAVCSLSADSTLYYFKSLQKAIDFAGNTPATVTLLKDVSEAVTVAALQEISLVLGSYELKQPESTSMSATAAVTCKGTLTVSGEAGSITGLINGIYVPEGTLKLMSGTVSGTVAALFVEKIGTANIYGGTLRSDSGYSISSLATVNIYGGCFAAAVYYASLSGTMTVKGGLFKQSPDADWLPGGYYVTGNTDPATAASYPYAIGCKAICSLTVGSTVKSFPLVQTAIDEAGTGQAVIKLLQDVSEDLTIGAGQNITLDLNGKTLSQKTWNAVITSNGNLTILGNGGSITGFALGAAFVCESGNLTIKNTKLSLNGIYGLYFTGDRLELTGCELSSIGVYSLSFSGSEALLSDTIISGIYPVIIGNGTFTMKSGSISAASDDPNITPIAFCVGGGTLNIVGGDINGGTGNAVWTTAAGAVNISGGKIKGLLAQEQDTKTGGKGTISLTGGLYSSSPDAGFIAECYKTAANTDSQTAGAYSLMLVPDEAAALCTLTQGESLRYYASLKKALDAAGSTEATIKLLKDANESITIAPGQTVTLDLAGFVLTAQDNTSAVYNSGNLTVISSQKTGHCFNSQPDTWTRDESSETGEKLTGGCITGGSGTLNNKGNYSGGGIYNGENAVLTVGANVNIVGNTAFGDFGGGIYNLGQAILNSGALVCGNHAVRGGGIYNGGSCTLNGTVSDNDATDFGGGIYNVKDSGCTLSGTVSGNTARYGGGIFNRGSLTINGGTVSGNEVEEEGGGIYSEKLGSLTLNDGTCVTGNTSGSSYPSGGIYCYPEDRGVALSLSGKVTVSGNTTNASPANLCLSGEVSGQLITGLALTEGAMVGVSFMVDDVEPEGYAPFSVGYGAALDQSVYFTSDNGIKRVLHETLSGGQHRLVLAIIYNAAGGEEGSWNKGSNKDYEMTFKRATEDASCYSHFMSVSLDGSALTEGTDYSSRSGSTVITLKASLLENLSPGSHTLTVFFDDGQVTAGFTVQAASDRPDTGDSLLLPVWILLMGAALWALPALQRKKQRL